MKKFILTNNDFSSIENIDNNFFIDNIIYYPMQDSLIIALKIPVARYIPEDEVESIISNKNRFIIIDDDRAYCCESKNKIHYEHNGFLYKLYLTDVKFNEMDKDLVNILNMILY